MAETTPVVPPIIQSTIEKYVSKRTEFEDLEPRYKELSKEVTQLSEQLCKLIDESGVTSINFKDYGTFIASFKGPYVGVKKVPGTEEYDDDAWTSLVEWAKATHDEAGHALIDFLFKFGPIHQRLNSEYKRRVEAGEELPPGVDVRTVPTVTWMNRPAHMKKKG